VSGDALLSSRNAHNFRRMPSTYITGKGTLCACSQRRQIRNGYFHNGPCIWYDALASASAGLRMGSDRQAVSSRNGFRNIRVCSSQAAPASLAERTHLASIYIQDFVLVKKQRVRFGTGMNVISGQSGSGKSVLLNAFNVILGMQASSDMVRSPADIGGELHFVPMFLCNTYAHLYVNVNACTPPSRRPYTSTVLCSVGCCYYAVMPLVHTHPSSSLYGV
jgi:hypothetical protein